nr:hypothetical protein [Tanacetum cinerariifolium]
LQALVDNKKVVVTEATIREALRLDDEECVELEQQVVEEGDADGNDETVNDGDAAEGDVSAAHEEVPTADEEPSIPFPTPHTPAGIVMNLLQKRVKTSDETVMDDESNQERMIAEMDQDADVVLEDDKEDDRVVADAVKDVHVEDSAQDQGRQAESQEKIYKIDLDHANKVLSMQEDETEPAKVQEVVDFVTTAKIIIEVVTAASETITTTSTTNTAAEA